MTSAWDTPPTDEEVQAGAWDTPPTEAEAAAVVPDGYADWLKANKVTETPDYDYRAAFEAGEGRDGKTGHFTDKYKTPTHPTFSTGSVASKGDTIGGQWVKANGRDKWEFRASAWNEKNRTREQLMDYFDRVEPGQTIRFTDGTKYTPGDRGPVPFGDESDQVALDNIVSQTIERAQTGGTEKELEASELAMALGMAPSDVMPSIEKFRATAKAMRENPRRWRQENPELFDLITRDPVLGATVMKDVTKWVDVITPNEEAFRAKHPWLAKLMPSLADHLNASGMDPGTDELTDGDGNVVARKETEQVRQQDMSRMSGNPVMQGIYAMGETGRRAYRENKLAKLGAARAYAEAYEYDGEPAKALREQSLLQKAFWVSKVGAESAPVEPTQAAEEIRKRIAEGRAEIGLPAFYGDGGVIKAVTGATEAVAGQTDSMGVLLIGGAIAVLGRSPKAGQLFTKVAGASTSFWTEMGGSYNNLVDTVDDQGKRVDRRVAFASAHLYGVLAAAVEVGALSIEMNGLKAYARSLVTDQTKRGALLSLFTKLTRNAAAEAGEEGAQSALEQTIEWLGKNASAIGVNDGGLQRANLPGALNEIGGSAGQGFVGGMLGVSLATMTIDAAHAMQNVSASRDAGARLAAIAEVAKTNAAQAAPRHVASWIASQQDKTGRRVTHLYVDPTKVVEQAIASGQRAEDVARELMGAEGPQRLQDALDLTADVPGSRATLEVPLAEYLEKWGAKPIAETLADHMATFQGGQTIDELKLLQSDIDDIAGAMGDAADMADDEAMTAEEAAAQGTLEEQLIASGLDPREARLNSTTQAAFARVMSKRWKIPFARFLSPTRLTVQGVDTEKPQAPRVQTTTKPPAPPTFKNVQDAYDSLINNADITGTADRAYNEWRNARPRRPKGKEKDKDIRKARRAAMAEWRARKPKAFADGTLDAVNEHLGLTGDKRVTGVREAFSRLVYREKGTFAERTREAIKVLRQVQGLENLQIPDEYMAALEDDRTDPNVTTDPETGEQLDTSFNFGPGFEESETLEQPAQQTDERFRAWFGDSKVVDASGKPLRVYHGTGRPDRVGAAFHKGRATSGPMPFFTDDPDIASKYAIGKQDTSLPETENGYADWFTVGEKRNKRNIVQLWNTLSQTERAHIAEVLPHVQLNEETGKAEIVEDYAVAGKSHWDHTIREHRGNVIKAAVDIWLDSGTLFNDEEAFGSILKAAGIEANYEPPHARFAAVYPVYLSIKNPMVTTAIPESVIADLEKASRRQKIPNDRGGADQWDKRTKNPRVWMDELKGDIAKGANSFVWTSIPDWVTRVLKAHGHDGIQDTGGKQGGAGHDVWIPFTPTQIKSATGNKGTFNPGKKSILFQSAADASVETIETLYQPAHHGTPHRDIDKFTTDAIGTGEGAQVRGWGLYFASKLGVADWYRKKLRPQRPTVVVDGAEVYGSIWGAIDSPDGRARAALASNARLLADLNQEPPTLQEIIDTAKQDWEARRSNAGAATFDGKRATETLAAIDKLAAEGRIAVTLSEPGQLHKVEIPENDELLDLDAQLINQPAGVLEKLKSIDALKEPIERAIANNAKHTSGEAIYKFLSKALGGDEAASKTLLAAGIPGSRFLDGSSRNAGEGSHNFVIWDDDAIEIRETLYQKDDAKSARGWVRIAKKGAEIQARIFLTKKSDASTFPHESAHAMFETMEAIAKDPRSPEGLRKDWAKLRKYVGAKDGEELTVAQKEKLARSWEAYLMEGKAPSAALAEVFYSFSRWLLEIYKSVTKLGVELNDDVRGVFDRMIATDREIELARDAAGLAPVASTPQEAGVDPKDFDAYLADKARSRTLVVNQTRRMIAEGQLRAAKAFKTDEFRKLVRRYESEYDALPESKAWRYLSMGEVVLPNGVIDRNTMRGKLSRNEVVNLLGADSRMLVRLKSRLNGTESAIDIAEQFGFTQGAADMLRRVAGLPAKEEWARQEAEREMRELHPEIDGEIANLQEAIQKLQHSDSLGEAERDWQTIKARTTDQVTLEALQLTAKRMVDDRLVGRIDPQNILNRERSFAQQAADAQLAGKFDEAMAFAHRRLLHKYLYKELMKARDDRESGLDLMADMADDESRKRLGRAGPEYRDVVDTILEALNIVGPRKQEEPRKRMDELMGRMALDGNGVAFDPILIGKLIAQPRKWQELKISEFREVIAALKNIRQGARNNTSDMIEGRRIDREETIAELEALAEENAPKNIKGLSTQQAGSAVDDVINFGRDADGFLLRPETMLEGLGWKPIIKMLQDAKYKRSGMLSEVAKPISEAFNKIPGKSRGRFREKIDGRKFFPNHRHDVPVPSRRYELFALFFNMGTESNQQRLLEGRGITREEVMRALSLLTREELAWAQSVLDQIESLWPQVRALEERDTGVAPEKLDATPIVVKSADGHDMVLRGGYFPAVYDERGDSLVGTKQALKSIADAMGMSNNGRPSTSRSHTKARAENFADAILLDPTVIQSHIVGVVQDLAFRETIRSVAGIMLDPRIRFILRQKLGEKRAKQFEPWLRDVGHGGATPVASLNGPEKVMRYLRGNVPMAVLGYNIRNALGDFTGGITAAIGTGLSKRHYMTGLVQFYLTKKDARAFAMSKSGELRSRSTDEESYRAFSRRMKALTQNRANQFAEAMASTAFYFQEQIEKTIATPIWLGAYNQGLAEGKGEEQAIDFADGIVRNALPVKDVVDKSGMQRDKGVLGFMAMFTGFANQVYNQDRRIWRPVFAAEGMKDTALSAVAATLNHAALMLVVGIVSEFIVGHGQEPDEKWEQWFMRKLIAAHLMQIPLAGGAAEKWLLGGQASDRTNPGFVAIEQVGKALGVGWDLAVEGKGEPIDVFFSAIRALGYARGLPTGFPTKLLEYLADGDYDNQGGIASGMLYGERANGNQADNPIKWLDRALE